MLRVFKFPLETLDSHKDGYHIVSVIGKAPMLPLSVQIQRGIPCLWAECDDTSSYYTTRELYSVGTGHGAVPKGKKYLGTVQQGEFVWHIYY